ncbi:hypothetical protein [Campylobacter vulpis]|uniref:hypothetical protein n=1 Tax=Campylobacter vulpis TaxID=1655500 RepID=UPI001BD14FDE|nr:hypothetical protein [Campylobacter vulpis]MBS4268422.1 hypothetical protein [Campylobacter vulpis]
MLVTREREREREREQAELKEILSEIESLLSQRKILQRFITKILQKAELTQSIHSLIASLPTPPKHGWERVRLGQVSQVIAGQSPQSQFYNDRQEGFYFFKEKRILAKNIYKILMFGLLKSQKKA